MMRKLRIANSQNNVVVIFKGEVPAKHISFAIDFFKKDCNVLGYNNKVFVRAASNIPLLEIKKQLEPILGKQVTIQHEQ